MARSEAAKKRLHSIRNGKQDPEMMRGYSPDFSTHVRKSPSKAELTRRSERKYRKYA